MAFTTTDGHTSGASAMRVEQGRMLYGLREIAAAPHCSEKNVCTMRHGMACPQARSAAAGVPTKPACGSANYSKLKFYLNLINLQFYSLYMFLNHLEIQLVLLRKIKFLGVPC